LVVWSVSRTPVDLRSKDVMQNCIFGECEKNLVEEPESQRFSVPSYLIILDVGNCEFEAKGKLMHWSTHEKNHFAAVLFA